MESVVKGPPIAPVHDAADRFWSWPPEDAFVRLRTNESGLSGAEAASRIREHGRNEIRSRRPAGGLALLLSQFRSPLVLMLVVAAVLAFVVHSRDEALILLAIIVLTGIVGFWHERSTGAAVAKLLALVAVRAQVLRDGGKEEIPVEDVVPGDVVLLAAGSLIPADGLLLEARDLFVDEAALTGETFAAEKIPGPCEADAAIPRRRGALFMGSHVVSGTGRMLVCATGRDTEFGRIAAHLRVQRPPTDFDRGVQHFGYMLMRVTLVLAMIIFAANVLLDRSTLEAFMFSMALAVGMTPELLPAIVSVNLSRGATRMSRSRVIVKRLSSIENLGTMNLLCSDKTGTLTDGRVILQGALDIDGGPSEGVLTHAVVNATLQTGISSPLDAALRAASREGMLSGWQPVDEIPYDFVRKRLGVLAEREGRALLITKGAVAEVLDVCTRALGPDGASLDLDGDLRARIEGTFRALSARGMRTLGIALRELAGRNHVERSDEADMTFTGFLSFWDPPKEGVREAIACLAALGIELRMLTGDNRHVAANVARAVGMVEPAVVTGQEVRMMSPEALVQRVRDTRVFAEVEPNQKDRILRACKQAGYVVGFLGDGINDAPALHAADVGISVEGAVDVAKDAAEIVLLQKDLGVIAAGVEEGRKTFVNTLKYIYITSSANFGNMLSMAAVAPFLSFLPLLPAQILLNNFLSDIPAMTLAGDRVDEENIRGPRRWNVRHIRDFMLIFGAISTCFDLLAFGGLVWLHAEIPEFRSSWFLVSLLTELFILFVMRTGRPFLRSAPSRPLLASGAAVAIASVLLVYLPAGRVFEFAPIAASHLTLVVAVTLGYLVVSERVKRWFFRRSAHGS